MDIPLDPEEAARLAAAPVAPVRLAEVADADGRPFVNLAATGLSVLAAHRARPLKARLGPLAYAVGGPAPAVAAAVAAAIIIVFRHRSNVVRLREGVAGARRRGEIHLGALAPQPFQDRRDRVHKFCRFFLFGSETAETRPELREGISECVWLPFDDALERITYDNAREVLREAGRKLSVAWPTAPEPQP